MLRQKLRLLHKGENFKKQSIHIVHSWEIKAAFLQKQAVENGVNGAPVVMATRADDPGQTLMEDRAKHVTFVEKEHEEEWDLPKSHAEMFTATQIEQKQLMEDLQQKAQKSESKFDLENKNQKRSLVAKSDTNGAE